VKPARGNLQAPKGKGASVTGRKSTTARLAISTASHEPAFREVLALIESARGRAFQAVNTELIDLYWRVGEYISRKIETVFWGQGVVAELAVYIQRHHPNLRGFTRASLFRMRQFFETYRDDKKSRTAGATITMVAPPYDFGTLQTSRGARILHPSRRPGRLEKARP